MRKGHAGGHETQHGCIFFDDYEEACTAIAESEDPQ
jgi:hypothetical protein